jgi:hypothetical protein
MDQTSPDFRPYDELYQRAAYLDSIISVNTGNNPHVGYGKYDMGSTYDEYMTSPFSHIVANAVLDQTLIDIINSNGDNGYTFPIEKFGVLDTETEGDDDSKNESKYYVNKTRSATEYENEQGELSKYFLNDKILVIKNLHRGNETYNQYFMNVIFPYISQVIPSTAMLLLDGFDIEFTDKTDLNFYCNCDKDRVEWALMLIGKSEIQEMIDDGKEVELGCQFCGKKYVFTVDELKEIQKKAK